MDVQPTGEKQYKREMRELISKLKTINEARKMYVFNRRRVMMSGQ